jgi:hypothetical protein
MADSSRRNSILHTTLEQKQGVAALNPFHKGQVDWWNNLPPVAVTLSLKKAKPSAVTKTPFA